jgi:hypothetical protein
MAEPKLVKAGVRQQPLAFASTEAAPKTEVFSVASLELPKVFQKLKTSKEGTLDGLPPGVDVILIVPPKTMKVQSPGDAIMGGDMVRRSVLLVWTEKPA